jgi:hypothetical protein
MENEPLDNRDLTDHPLELTLKNFQQSNRVLSSPAKSTTDIHNLVVCSLKTSNTLPSPLSKTADPNLSFLFR